MLDAKLLWILEPLYGHDREIIRRKIYTELKQSNGEGWVIGEVVERALVLLEEKEELSNDANIRNPRR